MNPLNPPDWMADAACEIDDWLFFDHGARDEAEAMAEAERVCGGCPVATNCLEYALTAEPHVAGIWAATTEVQRRRMRRNLKRESRAQNAGAA